MCYNPLKLLHNEIQKIHLFYIIYANIYSIMEYSSSKIKKLMTCPRPQGSIWLSSTLQAEGHSLPLLSWYVKSGWLYSPAKGVYLKAGERPHPLCPFGSRSKPSKT